MRRGFVIPLVILLLLAGWAIFGGAAREQRADFTFINRGETKTLDLNRISWAQDIRTAYILWEGLYTIDPVRTLGTVPGCADPVELSDDKTDYTFHIRPTAKWTNGADLTAHDFLFSWRRNLEEPGDYSYLLYYIRGAEDYSNAFVAYLEANKKYLEAHPDYRNALAAYNEKLKLADWDPAKVSRPRPQPPADSNPPAPPDFKTVGMEALDAKTFRVTLKNPVPYFPDITAFPPEFPLYEPSLRKFRQVDRDTGAVTYDKKFTRPPNLVSNGPFRLDAWAYKQNVHFVKSEHYWERARVKSNTIDMVSCEEPMAQFLLFHSGSVDWVADISIAPEVAADLKKQQSPNINVGPGFGTYFYSIRVLPTLPDGRPNPFADKRVRQALSMAIDKRPVVDNVTKLGEPITSNYIPVGVFPGYQSPPGLPYDVAKARELLAAAGYPGGKGWPRLSLLYNTGAHHADVAQIVRRQWAEQLGIDIELEGVEIKTFGERLHNKDYAIARASWIGDYMDPSTFTDKYLTNGGNNDSGWSNKDYDRLCAEAAVVTNNAERLKKLREAEAILLEEQPIIPVYHYVNADLRRSVVHGIKENPRNNVNFRDVYVEK
jgi:oligopeptide transport system substrate-binding protein